MQPEVFSCSVPGSETVPAHGLTCYRWGSKDAQETVLCMHGLTRNARDFDFLAQALCDRYQVIAPDMPGRGKSPPLADPAGYHYATYVSDTLVLMAMLGLQKAHLVGTSMGGIIGMMVANAAPGFLQSLTLNDIGCLIPASGLRRIINYAGVATRFASREEAERAMRTNMAPFGITQEAHWQHLFEHSLVENEDGVTLAYDMGIVSGFPPADKVEDIDLWSLWEGVRKVPALLIRGEESDILLHETALKMQAGHPRLTYVQIPGTGHAPMLMEEKQTALIRNWISAV